MPKSFVLKILFLAIGAISFSCITSCSDDYIYEKEIKVDGGAWSYGDTLAFEFNISDTTKIYSLLLDVTHSPDYGFQNLYVQLHTRYPAGKVEKQVLSLELASQSGVWNGACNSDECTLEIPLLEKAIFSEAGKYTLSVEQYMRQSPLAGVMGMALKIKPAGMR